MCVCVCVCMRPYVCVCVCVHACARAFVCTEERRGKKPENSRVTQHKCVKKKKSACICIDGERVCMWWKMSVRASPKSHHTANVDVKLNRLLHHLSGGSLLVIRLSY